MDIGHCSVEGCVERIKNREHALCNKHYRRLCRYGSPTGGARPAGNQKCGICGVVDCGLRTYCSGLCKTHYEQRQRGVEPHLITRRAPRGDGHITSNGYRKVMARGHANADGNGQIMEHRLLMSQVLGRSLEDNETAHHRDGNRTNNTVGPCFLRPACDCPGGKRHNLELWSTKQPMGQRVADKLAWAREVLALYGHLG